MLQRDSKSEALATKVKERQRHCTIGYALNGGKNRPARNFGFNTGQPMIVTVERGKLVIETELRFWM